MTTPLSDERIQEIIREEEERADAEDARARAERLAGLRCMCCSELLPADWLGDECASCADIQL